MNLSLDLMYNLIRFTDICLELSFIIILAKHDTTFDHLMTRPLIWTACTAVAAWICIHWVPADTPDIPEVFILSFSSAEKFRLSARLDQANPFANFFWFLFVSNQPTLCSRRTSWKIKKGRGTEWKEERKVGRKTERKIERKYYLLTQSGKLRNPKNRCTRIFSSKLLPVRC